MLQSRQCSLPEEENEERYEQRRLKTLELLNIFCRQVLLLNAMQSRDIHESNRIDYTVKKHIAENGMPLTVCDIWIFRYLGIGESPSICPFLKNNGHEAPKGPSAIIFQEWTDTSTFSYLKYTLIYNYV